MKRIPVKVLAVVIVTAMFASAFSLLSSAYMAYNIYGNPLLSGTSGLFDTYTIDFRSQMTPYYTYWSLANFGLYFSPETKAAYPGISGGGAYAGLQDRGSYYKNAGIMSFWEMKYTPSGASEKVIMNASRVYPNGSSSFSGEGDGTNCIYEYPWKDDQWYRMVIHSWDDEESGTTYVGEWFEDLATGEWTLFCYFDTHLYKSAMNGAMSFFQENYVDSTWDQVRNFNFKNAYAYDHVNKNWKSCNTFRLSYGDGGRANKMGQHEFGVRSDEDGEFFWGISGGAVDDQEAYNAASISSKYYSISQPALPSFGEADIESVRLLGSGSSKSVEWDIPSTNTPQLSYSVKAVGVDGGTLFEKSGTRPEVTSCKLEGVNTDAYKCTVTVTDIFGERTSLSAKTPAYAAAVGEEPDEEIIKGTWSHGKWTLLNGVLTITGNGDMDNYRGHEDDRPWISYLDDIEKVVIEKGVTSVGSSSFTHCNSLKEVVCGEDVTSIGMDAFSYDGALTDITFYGPITDVGQGTVYSSGNLETVYLTGQSEEEFLEIATVLAYNDNYRRVTFHMTVGKLNEFDYNADGQANIVDVTALLNHLSTSADPSSDRSADINGDGAVSIDDVTILLTYISGGDVGAMAGDLKYELNDGRNGYIVKGIGRYQDSVLTIPSEHNGLPVTGIAPSAFADCLSITKVVIPDSVTELGDHAFTRCDLLEEVVCGRGITVLEMDVFAYDPSLVKLVFNAPITYIAQGTVYLSDALQYVTITGQTQAQFLAIAEKSAYNTSFNGATFTVNVASSLSLSEEALRDRIEGGWIGQMAGVAWGASTEFCYAGRLIPASSVPSWSASMINSAFDQDDLYVEIPFLDTMNKKGVDCDPGLIAAAFKTTQFGLWHANGMARQNLKDGIGYPDSGSYLYNYHCDDIDWQIECDFLGMLYPGMVSEAAAKAFELGHIMNYGDGVYGGVFISAMHSAAFTAESIEEIVEAGISVIPEGTLFRALIDDVMTSYRAGDTFEQNWNKLQTKWGEVDLCPELPGKSNIDAKLNSGYVLLGLLYGNGDMDQTIILSMRCGQDSDCNPSSAASILGNYLGASGIADKYKSALDRTEQKFSYTQYTYESAVNLNVTLAKQVLENAGAASADGVWTYTVNSAFEPVPFEQWPDGVYVYFRASLSGGKVTFGEVTPYNKNEEIVGFTIDMGDGRIFYDVIPTSYTYAEPGTYTVKVTVTGKNGSVSEKTKSLTVRTAGAAEDAVIICSVTAPAGGGSKNAEVIRDGVIPVPGDPDSKQYDTYTLGDPSGNPDKTAYIGYAYKTPRTVSKVIFTEGNHFGNGGWFKNGTLRVQVLQNGVWKNVTFTVSPSYPRANSMSAFGDPYQTYTFSFGSPQVCDGVRLIGTAGGSAGFISVGELSVE